MSWFQSFWKQQGKNKKSHIVEKDVKFSLKLMINKDNSKVLFASIDSDLADVLLSFLTLPLGRIIGLLESHYGDQAPTFGCLTTLRAGLQNLDNVYFETEAGKLMLLNPEISFNEELSRLRLDISGDQTTKFFACKCYQSKHPFRVTASIYHPGAICRCGKLVKTAIKVAKESNNSNRDEVFTKQFVSFLISDDLRMVPNVSGSFLQDLKNLGITDIQGARHVSATVGFDEVMGLLKGLLYSRTSLTDIFLRNEQLQKFATADYELLSLWPLLENGENCRSFKKMKINVMMQKSSSRFLFAQAKSDFVEFLFSFLTFPLGQVESLLNANSDLGSLDNFYRSVADFNAKECLVYSKDALMKPNLPHKYLSNNQKFSLAEQEQPVIYLHKHIDEYSKVHHWSSSDATSLFYKIYPVSLVDPKGQFGIYVKNNRMFIVTDDLTVMPFSMHTSVSTLMWQDIPLSDIEELEFNIGLEEALSILKASLTSRCAITNGLRLNTIKHSKKEH